MQEVGQFHCETKQLLSCVLEMKVLKQYPLTATFLSLCVGICIIPPFVFSDLYSDINYETPLRKAWNSTPVIYSELICLGCAWPLLLDMMSDFIGKLTKSHVCKILLLISLIFPNFFWIVFSMWVHDESFYKFIPSILNIRVILVFVSLVFSITEYGSPVWTTRRISAIVILNTIGLVLDVFGGFLHDQYSFWIIERVLMCISFGMIAFFSLSWIMYVRSSSEKLKSIDIYCCNIYLFSLFVMILCQTILGVGFKSQRWSDVTTTNIVATNYTLSFITIMALVFIGRVNRIQILYKQVLLHAIF